MICIDRVQVIGISDIKTLGDRTIRYLTIVTGNGGVQQFALEADRWIGDTEDHVRKRLEVIEFGAATQAIAPKHDEWDGA